MGTTIGSGGGEEGEEGEKQQWDDESGGELQGRLLLLQLAAPTAASAGGSRAAAWQEAAPWQEAEAPRRQLQLLPVAELHLPSRVLALCPGTTRLTGAGPGPGPASAAAASGTGTGAGVGSRLFASVGRRLVAFEWRQRQQALRRVTWIPTNRPLCDLKVCVLPQAAASWMPRLVKAGSCLWCSCWCSLHWQLHLHRDRAASAPCDALAAPGVESRLPCR